LYQRYSQLLICVILTLAIPAAGRLFAIETGPVAQPPAVPLYSGRTQDSTPDASVAEYLIPDNSSAEGTYLECYRESLNPLVGCKSLTTFGNSLSLVVSFRRSQLEKWRDMLRAAEGLVSSFKE
jgi:hypothetical protein